MTTRTRTALRSGVLLAFASLSLCVPFLPSAAGQQPTDTFTISGDVCCLTPGGRHAIDVTLTNPNAYPIHVNGITTRITASPPRCEAASNVRLTQSTVSTSGRVMLPADRSVHLLGDRRPQIELIDLPVNQDACKNQAFLLTYTGTASAPDGVAVLGVAHEPTEVAAGEGTLPRTGVYVGSFVLIGLASIVIGGLLRLLTARRRRSELST